MGVPGQAHVAGSDCHFERPQDQERKDGDLRLQQQLLLQDSLFLPMGKETDHRTPGPFSGSFSAA